MNNLSALDIQYSPSQWSKRGTGEWVLKNHVCFATKESEDVKLNIPCQLNIPYGELINEKYDLFGTDLPDESPIHIYIHGGYWQELHRNISSYIVAPLYKNKIKVIVIGYSLCPNVKLIDIMQEIKTAVSKCIDYAEKKNAKYVSIAGHSAGAHLTATLFSSFFSNPISNKLIKNIYLISGVYNLTPLVQTYVNEPLHLDIDEAKKLSPLYHNFKITQSNVQFHIIVGENESPAFIQQSEVFYKKLKELHHNVNLKIISKVDHFDIVENLNKDNFELTRAIIQTNTSS